VTQGLKGSTQLFFYTEQVIKDERCGFLNNIEGSLLQSAEMIRIRVGHAVPAVSMTKR